jgi:large subunit ribosomal protein L24
MKLSHGDSVIVISGKDKGKKGTVMRVLKNENRVIVSGVNMVTKHVKRTAQSEGQKIKYEASISASNIAILDPKTGKATRIGYKIEGGKKIRIAKKSGSTLTRVKLTGDAAEAAKKSAKSPFWKKAGFGADAAAGATGAKAASDAPAAAPVTQHRSAGRGS